MARGLDIFRDKWTLLVIRDRCQTPLWGGHRVVGKNPDQHPGGPLKRFIYLV